MTTPKKLFKKTTHYGSLNPRNLKQNLLLAGVLFSMLCVFESSIAQSSASKSVSSLSTEATGITYKFTIVGVVTQAEADEVLELLLGNPVVASCKYFDEARCFKLTVYETLTYQSLANVLLEKNLVLSENVYLSDETILSAKPNLIKQ